jgi:hypothetical protein
MEHLRKQGAALVYRCAKQRSVPTSDKRGAAATGDGAPGVLPQPTQPETVLPKRSPSHYLGVVLIARIYEVFPLLYPKCGGPDAHHPVITHSAASAPVIAFLSSVFVC